MKSSPNDTLLSNPEVMPADAISPRRHPWRWIRGILTQFRSDLREPLPGDSERSFAAKVGARGRHLLKRYGWKLVWAIVIYYFIRDMLLYVILPYFVARSLMR